MNLEKGDRPTMRDPDDRAAEIVRGGAEAGQRTLVLFPGALGDAVCLEPTVAVLSERGPVTLYARGAAAEVAALFPTPPEVRRLDSLEMARLFSPPAEPWRDDWLRPFSRIVSFTGSSVPSVVARLEASGRATVAPFPRPPLAMHAADYFLRAATGDAAAMALPSRLVAPDVGGGRAASLPVPPLILLPGSAAPAKRAAPEVFVGLATRWRSAGGEVAIVLGPAEDDDLDRDWQAFGRVVRPTSIAELAGCLAGGAAFVGNDSGPSHVAAALGRPGIVVFTTTDPAHFGPRGADVVAARATSRVDGLWDTLGRALP